MSKDFRLQKDCTIIELPIHRYKPKGATSCRKWTQPTGHRHEVQPCRPLHWGNLSAGIKFLVQTSVFYEQEDELRKLPWMRLICAVTAGSRIALNARLKSVFLRCHTSVYGACSYHRLRNPELDQNRSPEALTTESTSSNKTHVRSPQILEPESRDGHDPEEHSLDDLVHQFRAAVQSQFLGLFVRVRRAKEINHRAINRRAKHPVIS